MKIVSIGGGPAGLYFAILAKRADPGRRIQVLERNRADDTFGFGVVFSDATMDNLARADAPSHAEITRAFSHWDDIDIHWRGEVVRSRGHGFAGLGRRQLLDILQRRAAELGVELVFQHDVVGADAVRALAKDADLVLGADGVNSLVRQAYAAELGPSIDWRPNRFVWLGTTFPFDAFTFYFKENRHGMWRVHAYRYAADQSTFIVECTEATWKASGLAVEREDDTIRYLEELFAEELRGHRLLKNRSLWRQFPIVRNERWSHENVVLVGDAVHTAHFSIGSGTKLALEDAIALHEAIEREADIPQALAAYEKARRPGVESLQRAAQVSLEWFEETERYRHMEPTQLAFSLLTRSLRVTHANLRKRDPELIARVDSWFAAKTGAPATTPPMFTPYTMRGTTLSNRVVVSSMCMYSADDGTVDDYHLVHLGALARGGAGLVMAEATGVSPEGRISPGCAGMYKPEHVPAWRRITDYVHRHTTAKIGMQLAHAGRKASCSVPWEGDAPLSPEAGAWPVIGPSPIPYKPGWPTPHELDRRGMDQIRDEFIRGVKMTLEAGFDWLELHYAHGYLMSTFLSPLTNRRTDEYGGDVSGRVRFPCEVVTAAREIWGDRPLAVRISATDWAPGGLSPEDLVATARALASAGADLIDVSSGGTVPEGRPRGGRLYQTPFSDRIRHEAGVPTITVGAVSSWDDINSILAAGRADLVALARAHLANPFFTRHAALDQEVPLDWPVQYRLARTLRRTSRD